MDSSDKFWTITTISILAAIIAVCMIISSCSNKEEQMMIPIKTACIQKSGDWVKLGDSTYGCQFSNKTVAVAVTAKE